MKPWTADVAIDDATACRLIADRFPHLDPPRLRLLGKGWDNHAYLVNDSIVFRIPHRKLGADLMATECAVLQVLREYSLPLSIPVPEYIAAQDENFPYPFAGYALIPGDTADTITWSEPERAKNAAPLGRFLKALHRVETGVPIAFGDELKRADLPFRFSRVAGRLDSAPSGFGSLLRDLSTTPLHMGLNRWVHGDLYSRHLVVDESRTVTGVIDWGDVHVGDPALDLAIAWMFLPRASWQEFKASYGGVDPDTWRRARFRAMTHWIYLSEYASDCSDKALQKECDFLLQNVMAGDSAVC